MNDRREPRLVRSSPNGFARQLLEAGLRDAPNATSMRSIASGLGLATGAGLGASIAASASAAPGATKAMISAGASISAGAAGGVGAPAGLLAAVVKWLAVGVLVGGTVSAGSAVLAPETKPTATRAAPTPDAANPLARRSIAATPTPEPPLTTSRRIEAPLPPTLESRNARLPLTPAGAGRPRHGNDVRPTLASAARSATKDEGDGALARETEWIDEARRALDRGDVARVYDALDRYDAGRRVGVLNREALVLRIEALLRQGRTNDARALTERFVARYPGDPHGERLRSRLETPGGRIDPSRP